MPQFLRIIREICEDTLVLAVFLAAIWGLGVANRVLFGADGLTFFEGGRLAFPLSWLLDAGHVSAISVYILRSVWRLLRGAREAS